MKKIESISHVLNLIAAFVLVLMMLLTTADVTGRYFFSKPITGTTELTEYMIVVLGFLALGWCAVKQGHLVVDLLMSRFSLKSQAAVDSFNYFVGIVISALISWRSFTEGIKVLQLGSTSSRLEIPEFPFYWVIGIGMAVLALVMITFFIRNIQKAIKG